MARRMRPLPPNPPYEFILGHKIKGHIDTLWGTEHGRPRLLTYPVKNSKAPQWNAFIIEAKYPDRLRDEDSIVGAGSHEREFEYLLDFYGDTVVEALEKLLAAIEDLVRQRM